MDEKNVESRDDCIDVFSVVEPFRSIFLSPLVKTSVGFALSPVFAFKKAGDGSVDGISFVRSLGVDCIRMLSSDVSSFSGKLSCVLEPEGVLEVDATDESPLRFPKASGWLVMKLWTEVCF